MAQKTEQLATRNLKARYGINGAGQVMIDFSGEKIDNLTMNPPQAIDMAKQILVAAHTQDPANLVGFKEWLENTFQVS